MKDNHIENAEVTADIAEAKEEEAAAELGKFKDVQALLQAYTALEAEFTRRSQRLKELEANKEPTPPAQPAAIGDAPSQAEGGQMPAVTEEIKNAVIAEYLNGVRKSRTVAFVTGGGAVTAAKRTPADVREAGALAKNFFDKKETK